MYPFLIFMLLFSSLSIVFAFVPAPRALNRMFPVPSLFLFLPERWVMPAGRVFVGVCGFVVCGMLLTVA